MTGLCRNNTTLCCLAASTCFYAEFNNKLKHGFSMLLIIMETLINLIQLLPRAALAYIVMNLPKLVIFDNELHNRVFIAAAIGNWSFDKINYYTCMVLGTQLDQIGVCFYYPLSIHWHDIRSYYFIKLTPHGFLVILYIPESHLMKCSTFCVNSAKSIKFFSINALTHALSASQAVIEISICCKSSPYP